jgi:16S rRNA (cytosine967-C5)-methyltransferase
MSRFFSYLNSATAIFQEYNGEDPFASFLKKYFALNKKFGSKDRKYVAHLCYCFFRLGKMLLALPVSQRIIAGLFICSTEPNQILEALNPHLNQKTGLTFKEKCVVFESLITEIFPWKEELTGKIEYENLCQSMLVQPDLFIRVRPGKEAVVKQKLETVNFDYKVETSSCTRLPNSTKVDAIIEIDKDAVIQDYNSQRVFELLQKQKVSFKDGFRVWDCCAASGGKSILVNDLFPKIELTVSDVRTSILHNLQKRFSIAGIKNYKSFVADLSREAAQIKPGFDLLICDSPCSGSGTWSRTPEQLYYFQREKINYYSELQKKITINAIKSLQKGGYFLYITCSVFEKENEGAVEFLLQQTDLQLQGMDYYKGYNIKADTLFAALFRL